jgi:Mg2+ and Co2+ transporter CorA
VEKPVEITVTEYNKDVCKQYTADLAEINPIGPDNTIRWINCEGRSKTFLSKLEETFQVHHIAIEDMEEIPQRKESWLLF